MCKCFENVKGSLLARMTDRIIEHHGVYGKPPLELEVDWKGYTYFMGGENYSPVNPVIKYSFRELKKNLTPKANLTKNESTMLGRFCPFCGEDKKPEQQWTARENVVGLVNGDKVWAQWTSGEVHMATFVEYPESSVFQRLCGTDEHGTGWNGDVGVVVRWVKIVQPEPVVTGDNPQIADES